MRRFIILLSFASLFALILSCVQPATENKLPAKADSQQNNLRAAYIPGTGEIMNGIIQPHHLKLWLAGQHKNWALAEYERHQLVGGFKRIKTYHSDQPEGAAVGMVDPAMLAIEKAIKEKDIHSFSQNYTLLTANCNTCHTALKYGFNIIVVPTVKDPENQKF